MKQKITKVWICLIGMMLCLGILSNQRVFAATPSYHAYSGGVTRGTIRYVSQSTSTASVNGWGSYASKANGECGYASQSMALSYVGKDISPEYLCYGEYAQGKWHTGYGNNISGTYEISGISVVSGSGNPSGGTAVNTINSMLTNFINDNGRGKYSPVVIHYASSSVMHAIIVIGKDANGNYLTLDPAKGMNVILMTLSSSGAVGGNVTYAANGCKINGVQQYYNASSPEPTSPVSFDSSDVSDITSTNATISTWVSNLGTVTEMGYYLGTSDLYQNKIVIKKDQVLWTRFNLSYNLYETYGKLSPGQTYTYVFYVVNDGKEYRSNVGHFTTSGNSIISFDTYSVSNITDTNAQTGVWFSNSDGAKISSIGFYYGTDIVNLKKVETITNVEWTRAHLLYDIGKYINGKLIPQSDYKLRYYVIANGTTYKSDYIYFTTGKDITPPEITNVKIFDISQDGYTITCNVSDESGINRVQFPTWTEHDGQDDLLALNEKYGLWNYADYARGDMSGNIVTYRVKTSDHNGEIGTYCTDIYAFDNAGNYGKVETKTLIPELKQHQHVYTSSIKKSATCTESGIRLYTCKDNDDSYEETIPATGHQHTELRNVKSATCGQEGYTGDTYCKDCNTKLSSGKSIAKKTHTWDAGKVTKGATCSAAGVKTYTCTVCKATKTESIAATGHQHTELRNVKSATCGQEGYTGDTFCKDCNTKLSFGKSIAKKAHTWDAGKITQKATCIAKGVKTFTCTVCQTTKTEEIPATGHGTRITKFAKNASCKTEGYTGDIYCQDCGILLEEGEVIQKTEHAWNDGKVTQDATCTEKGVKTYTCTVCQATKTEEIPATGHGKTEVRNQKDATCKAEGYTGDSYCTVCNQKICAGKKIAKTAHSWDKGKITRQPTTAKTGIKTYTCTKCKTTRTETIAKLKVKKLAVGKIIKDKATNGVYKVLKGGLSVEFTKPITKKASVKIPDTIKAGGVTCKVTGISANAFKSNSSLKTISIGKNVMIIGNNAFYGCKKLNKITGGNSIAKIGEKAFANCGSLSSVTIAGSVRSIGKQAFYNCKKLKSIVVNTVALTDKNIGAKAFTGTYAKPTVKVPAKQLKAYQKLLRSKGMSSKAKYKK